MDMDANFKKDISEFIKLINHSNEQSKIKKYYFSLVKKYHPDSASSELKNRHNEYMIIINKLYSQGKTKVKEINISSDGVQKTSKSNAKIYVFRDYYGREKKYTNYLEYIMHLGISEFDIGREVLTFGNRNELIKRNTTYIFNYEKNRLEAMQHFYNASKCFNYIINNYPNYVFIEYVKEEYEKVLNLNNYLSNIMVTSDSKELSNN